MKRTTCPECHGTGQFCYFKGESRFILSREECPACCGLGFLEVEEPEGEPPEHHDKGRPEE